MKKTHEKFVAKSYKLKRDAAPLSYMLASRHSSRLPLLFFDDYGLFPNTVMKCINELVDAGTLRIIKKIGHKKNVVFEKTAHKILKDYEGLICQTV